MTLARRRVRRARGGVAAMVLAFIPGACGAPGYLPAPTPVIDVQAKEFSFSFPSELLRRGQLVFRVRNEGAQPHELVLVGLPDDVKSIADELASKEARALSTVFILRSLAPDGAGMFAVNLDRGRYAFACFLDDGAGRTHAELGMTADVTIP